MPSAPGLRKVRPKYRQPEPGKETRLTHIHQSVRHHETNARLFVGLAVLAFLGMGAALSDALRPSGEEFIWFFGLLAAGALLLAAIHWQKGKGVRRRL